MIPSLPNPVRFHALALAALCLLGIGCDSAPGRPKPEPEVPRPEQVIDFHTLYKQNCTSCHGDNGKGGPAIPLANPVYLAVAGEDTIRQTISKGIPGTLMPPFGKPSGGMLTDQQIASIAHGIVQSWSDPAALSGQTPPPYAATLSGDPTRGQQAYTTACARCHGATGTGTTVDSTKIGSIVDPSYLALINDQYLRSLILAGIPGHMPDWRKDAAQPLTDQQITDIVAWLAAHRTANPGQPYPDALPGHPAPQE